MKTECLKVLLTAFLLVFDIDDGTSTLIKIKHLKDYLKHKKKEKKEEGLRVRCGIDATRIEYVKIPPKYETICWRKREKACKVVYELEDVYEDSCGDDYYKRCNKWRTDNHAGKDLLRPHVEKDLLRPGHNNDEYYDEPHEDYRVRPGHSNDYYDEPHDDDRLPLPPVIQNGRYKDKLRDRDYARQPHRPLLHMQRVYPGRGKGKLRPPGNRHRHAMQRPSHDRQQHQRGKRKVFDPDPGILFEPKPDIFDKPLFLPQRKKGGTKSPGHLHSGKLHQNGGKEESESHKIPLPFDQFRRFLLQDSFAEGGYGSNLMNSQPKFDLGNFKEKMSVDMAAERVDPALLHPSGAGHYIDECTEKRCHDVYDDVCRDTVRFQSSDVGKEKTFPENNFWRGIGKTWVRPLGKASKECTRVPRRECQWVQKRGCSNKRGKRRFRRFVDQDWFDEGSEYNGWDECLHDCFSHPKKHKVPVKKCGHVWKKICKDVLVWPGRKVPRSYSTEVCHLPRWKKRRRKKK